MSAKRIIGLALFSGVLLSLPWLIRGSGYVLFVAFCPLLISGEFQDQSDQSGKSSRLFPSFITFLTWNLLSTWWIAYASFSGMLAIAFLNALAMTLAWNLPYFMNRTRSKQSSNLLLIIFWLAFEFLQHHSALPWPWLTLGNGLAFLNQAIQWYEFTGVSGGSLLILLVNILLFRILSVNDFRQKLKFGMLLVVLLISSFSVSHYLYRSYTEKSDGINALIIQPSIDPYTEKFSGMNDDQQIDRIMNLVNSDDSARIDMIVAPETAWAPLWHDSLLTQRHSLYQAELMLERIGAKYFLTGALTMKVESEGFRRKNRDTILTYNSAVFLHSGGKVGMSHKTILVNGVEQVPFQKYLKFLPDVLIDLGGTNRALTAGISPELFEIGNGGKVGTAICFESVFGDYVAEIARSGASLLVVITNDGWWKESAGVWQHFDFSKIRAIETRRSIVRCANTGLSGVIDQRGNALMAGDIGKAISTVSTVNQNNVITFYSRNGDWIGKISCICAVCLLGFAAFEHVWKKKNPH